jgi:hypothetical protein
MLLIKSTGATGDVFSAIKNPLPGEIETKNLAVTFGCKKRKWKLFTSLQKRAARFRRFRHRSSTSLCE